MSDKELYQQKKQAELNEWNVSIEMRQIVS